MNRKLTVSVLSAICVLAAIGGSMVAGEGAGTGRLFEYDGSKITDRAGWPPKLAGVSGSAREAQTTVIFGGEVLVGVWPRGDGIYGKFGGPAIQGTLLR